MMMRMTVSGQLGRQFFFLFSRSNKPAVSCRQIPSGERGGKGMKRRKVEEDWASFEGEGGDGEKTGSHCLGRNC